MSDLVERLRSHMGKADMGDVLRDCREAAARIEALEAALREIKDTTDDPDVAEIAFLALAPEQDK